MHLKHVFFILTLLFFCSLAYAGKPILNLVDIPIPINTDGSSPDIGVISEAIISACRNRGWTPTLAGENKINASILIRSRHYAEVEIPFSEAGYSILYKSSRELDYDQKKQKIHRNYNNWVAKLSSSIQREFGVRAQNF